VVQELLGIILKTNQQNILNTQNINNMAKVRVVKPTVVAGDPAKPADNNMVLSSRSKLDTDLDLRDKLSELAIRGNALHPDDKTAIFGYLTNAFGRDKAQKIINHAYIFNSRPDMQGLSPEEKLKSFYTIGSTDPDVQDVISKTKNLGYGILPGYRGSSSAINQAVQKGSYGGAVGAVDPEIQKKVMIRVSK
jgi:hypothetical protein